MYRLKDFLNNEKFYLKEFKKRNFPNIEEKIIKLKEFNNKYHEYENKIKLINEKSKESKDFEKIKKNGILRKEYIKLADEFINKCHEILFSFPNIVHPTTPLKENEIIQTVNKYKKNNNNNDNLTYIEIAKKFNLIDFEKSSNIYGTRHVVYTDKGAKIIRALINLCLDFNINEGYKEIISPDIIPQKTMIKTRKYNKFLNDMYEIKNTNYWLSPTSEVQLMSFYQNKILDPNKLYKLTSFSNCFRKEAGASGSNNKGNLRLHQFRKVEIIQLTTKENNWKTFNKMNETITKLIEVFELNYRIINLAINDLPINVAKTYDFEIFFENSNKYIEISSLSMCLEYQTSSLQIRYADPNNNIKRFFYSINGSSLAIDRLFSAMIEKHYSNNEINFPDILNKYLGFAKLTI